MSKLFICSLSEFYTGGKLRPLLRMCFASLMMYFNTYKDKYGEFSPLVQKILHAASTCGLKEPQVIDISNRMLNGYQFLNREEDSIDKKLDRIISLLESSEHPRANVPDNQIFQRGADLSEEKLNTIINLLRDRVEINIQDTPMQDRKMASRDKTDCNTNQSSDFADSVGPTKNAFELMMHQRKDSCPIQKSSSNQKLKDILIHIAVTQRLKTYSLKSAKCEFIDAKNVSHYNRVMDFVDIHKDLYAAELEELKKARPGSTAEGADESTITAAIRIEKAVISKILEGQGLKEEGTRADGTFLGLSKRLREIEKTKSRNE